MKRLSTISVAVCFGILGFLLAGCTSNGPNNPASNEPTATVPPPPPELIAPYSGMPGNQLALSLRWEEIDNAECYRVQIAASEDFSADIVNEYDVMENITGVAGLDQNTDYYWRVRAKNSGGYGDWSPTWSFSTGDGIPPNSIEGSWRLVEGIVHGGYSFEEHIHLNGLLIMSLGSGKFDLEGEMIVLDQTYYGPSYDPAGISYVEPVDEEGAYMLQDSMITLPVEAFDFPQFDDYYYQPSENIYTIQGDTLRLWSYYDPFYGYWFYDQILRFVRN
ncbi:MAG: fibronectin type III domain-containing protein [bacterium]|nr:fibronectin type III domain-containing protein [bacterium]